MSGKSAAELALQRKYELLRKKKQVRGQDCAPAPAAAAPDHFNRHRPCRPHCRRARPSSEWPRQRVSSGFQPTGMVLAGRPLRAHPRAGCRRALRRGRGEGGGHPSPEGAARGAGRRRRRPLCTASSSSSSPGSASCRPEAGHHQAQAGDAQEGRRWGRAAPGSSSGSSSSGSCAAAARAAKAGGAAPAATQAAAAAAGGGPRGRRT